MLTLKNQSYTSRLKTHHIHVDLKNHIHVDFKTHYIHVDLKNHIHVDFKTHYIHADLTAD